MLLNDCRHIQSARTFEHGNEWAERDDQSSNSIFVYLIIILRNIMYIPSVSDEEEYYTFHSLHFSCSASFSANIQFFKQKNKTKNKQTSTIFVLHSKPNWIIFCIICYFVCVCFCFCFFDFEVTPMRVVGWCRHAYINIYKKKINLKGNIISHYYWIYMASLLLRSRIQMKHIIYVVLLTRHSRTLLPHAIIAGITLQIYPQDSKLTMCCFAQNRYGTAPVRRQTNSALCAKRRFAQLVHFRLPIVDDVSDLEIRKKLVSNQEFALFCLFGVCHCDAKRIQWNEDHMHMVMVHDALANERFNIYEHPFFLVLLRSGKGTSS